MNAEGCKPVVTQETKVRTEPINELIYDIECRRHKVTVETQTIQQEDDDGFDGPKFGARSPGVNFSAANTSDIAYTVGEP